VSSETNKSILWASETPTADFMRIQPLSLVFQQSCHDKSYTGTEWCASSLLTFYLQYKHTPAEASHMSAQVDTTVYNTLLFSGVKVCFFSPFTHSWTHVGYCTLSSSLVRLLFCGLAAVTVDGERQENIEISTAHNPCIMFKKTFPSEPQLERY